MLSSSHLKKLFIGFLLIFFMIGIWMIYSSPEQNQPKTVLLGEKTYILEIADTYAERGLGLGERERLCDACAMLFVFPSTDQHAFWMKGMRFPIDIVWLLGERVVHIEREIPHTSKEVFTPRGAADRVLELNAGQAAGLQVGDILRFGS